VASDASDVPSAALAQVAIRYDLYKRLVPVFYILASALPIYAMAPIAQAFAGRQTNLTFTLTAALSISVVLGAGNVLQWLRVRGQAGELKRLRQRVTTLEEELKVLKGPQK